MIIQGVTDLAFKLIFKMFQGFDFISLPVELITVLVQFMRYGAWIIGADFLGIVFATVFAWLAFKFSAGLFVFLWRLLPLT